MLTGHGRVYLGSRLIFPWADFSMDFEAKEEFVPEEVFKRRKFEFTGLSSQEIGKIISQDPIPFKTMRIFMSNRRNIRAKIKGKIQYSIITMDRSGLTKINLLIIAENLEWFGKKKNERKFKCQTKKP